MGALGRVACGLWVAAMAALARSTDSSRVGGMRMFASAMRAVAILFTLLAPFTIQYDETSPSRPWQKRCSRVAWRVKVLR